MPSGEKVKRSQLTSVVDSFLLDKRKSQGDSEVQFLNILEFINHFQLLPQGLFPVQQFILKLYYNLPLDDEIPENENDRIKIQDRFGNFKGYLSETQYIEYLNKQGRCNLKKQNVTENRRELILILGRRAGKSTLSAIITVYELYKLLRHGDPHDYYGIPSGWEIKIFCIANDKDQAEIVYQAISAYTTTLDYFADSIVHDTKTYQQFQTAKDVEKWGKGNLKDGGRGSLTATFKSAIAKGLRGRANIIVILDEVAFFGEEGRSSGKEIYRSLTPATAQFSPKDPKDKRKPLGPTDGKIILISSPDAREGFLYKQYQTALSGGKAAREMLMIQAPTWEVNPTLDPSYYETEYAKNPTAFDTEHGANFSDRVRGWIENKSDLTDCIIPDLKPLRRGQPREMFFAGLDFGISKDGTSLVLTHLVDGRIQLAYHETWYAGKSWKDANPHLLNAPTPYTHSLVNVDRLDIDEIVDWILAISKRFYIQSGVFDQYAGHIFEQKLHKAGLTQFEMRKFSTSDSSNCYMNAKMMMFTKQLGIYDYPTEKTSSNMELELDNHSPHVNELLELQATSAGKNLYLVEAPDIKGKHDDFSDAFVRSCLMATEHIKDYPDSLDASHGGIPAAAVNRRIRSPQQARRHRMRMHGGPPKHRRVPGRNK